MLVIGAGIRTRTEFLLLAIGFIVWNLKMAQHGMRAWVASGFSFRAWGVSGAPGWFRNSGEFGIEMCVFLPFVGYFAYGLWPKIDRIRRVLLASIVFSAIITIVAGSSRGAALEAAAVGLWVMLRSPRRVTASLIVAVLAGAIWVLLPEGNKARWRDVGEDPDSVRRPTYWTHGLDIAGDHPLPGIGYKNWLSYYRTYYNPEGELPHNYFVEAAAELGYTGFGVLLVVSGAYFWTNARTRRLSGPGSQQPDRLLWAMSHELDGAMNGFMASGFFVSVLWHSFIWMNVTLALALSRVTHDRLASKTGRSSHPSAAMPSAVDRGFGRPTQSPQNPSP
jgi:O-antigen ligase